MTAEIHNLENDMGWVCDCGSTKFNLLKSSKIGCSACGAAVVGSGWGLSGVSFDSEDSSTWPKDAQDVQIFSTECGFTHGVFYKGDDDEPPFFGNWFDRIGDEEDADYRKVEGDIEWWNLPIMKPSPQP